jgi:hypothetical protein
VAACGGVVQAIRITASGGKTYLAQYTRGGKKHRVALGACSAISLTQARSAAQAVMGDVAHDKDPAAERRRCIFALSAPARVTSQKPKEL